MNQIVEAYRSAAMHLYGISEELAAQAIRAPENDPGEWAPNSLAVLILEHEGLAALSYYDPYFLDRCIDLANEAGQGYIECINPAVCAVYP